MLEGSQAYYQCLAASKVIHEVEAGAAELKAEEARLEATIQVLEKLGGEDSARDAPKTACGEIR